MQIAKARKIEVGAVVLLACVVLAFLTQGAAAAGAGGSALTVIEPAPPAPAPAAATGVAYSDLLPLGKGRLLAVTNTFVHRPSYFAVAELTTAGQLVGSFGEGGYAAPPPSAAPPTKGSPAPGRWPGRAPGSSWPASRKPN